MNGKEAVAAPPRTSSQRRLAPAMKSVPTRIAPKTIEGPRAGCVSTGAGARAAGDPVGEDDDHEDLGQLRELELEAEDGDPAGHAAHAVADQERGDEQPHVHEVERPRERLQPAVG